MVQTVYMGENPINGVRRKRGSSQRFSLKCVDLGEKANNLLQTVFSLPVLDYGLFLAGFFFFSVGFWGFFSINMQTREFLGKMGLC